MARKGEAVWTAGGVGLYAAVALGCVNQAAHATEWGARVMFAAFAAYAASAAVRLAGPRRAASVAGSLVSSAVVVAGALLPMAARPEGRTVWDGGTWIAAAGAAVAFLAACSLGGSFGIAPADRGTVSRGPYRAVRHPMAVSLVLVSAGYLLVRFSTWNALVLSAAASFAVASALWEERLLRGNEEYRTYAARVRWRFVPWLV